MFMFIILSYRPFRINNLFMSNTIRNKKNKKIRYISCLVLNLNKNTTHNWSLLLLTIVHNFNGIIVLNNYLYFILKSMYLV